MSDEIKEILDKAKEISDYGADGKQHTRMFNQFEAKALLDYITNLQQENDRLNNIRKYAIQFININQHEKTFVLDYYDLKKLRGILNDNDFYIELFKEQLKELKENNNAKD